MDSKQNVVTVRWFDGYLEEFEASEVRFGAYILWMRLTSGKERVIPLTQVRWFSQSVESHQTIVDNTSDAKQLYDIMKGGVYTETDKSGHSSIRQGTESYKEMPARPFSNGSTKP